MIMMSTLGFNGRLFMYCLLFVIAWLTHSSPPRATPLMSNRDIPEPIKFFWYASFCYTFKLSQLISLSFAELVQEIAKKSKAKSIAERKAAAKDQAKTWFPALSVFKAYSQDLQAGPLPPGTTSILFRFLFPEEDHKRKFGLRNKSLIRDIADSLGVTEDAFCEQCDFAGCPGDYVYEFLLQRYSVSVIAFN